MFKLRLDCDKGGIMLLTLMILLITSLLGLVIIEVGTMEAKSSRYNIELQQAQQAADAGVEWVMENIYSELTTFNNLYAVNLPVSLMCGNKNMIFAENSGRCTVTVGTIVKIDNPSADSSSCTYEFTSTGKFGRANKPITVRSTYKFSGGYYSFVEDREVFLPRQYIDRGRIILYKNLF